MKSNPESFFFLLRRISSIIPRRRFWQSIIIVNLIVITAIAEVATLGAIFPFLKMISNPETLEGLSWLTDYLGANSQKDRILIVALSLIAISIASLILRLTLVVFNQKFTAAIARDISVEFYRSVISQPYEFHKDNNSSKVLSGVQNTNEISNKLIGPAIKSFSAIVISTFIVSGMIFVSPGPMFITLFLIGFAYVCISLSVRGYLVRVSGEYAQLAQKRIQIVQEGLGNIREIILDDTQDRQIQNFTWHETLFRKIQANFLIVDQAPKLLMETIVLVTIISLSLVFLSLNGSMSEALPILGVLAIGAQRLVPMLQQVYSGYVQMSGARSIADQVLKVIELHTGNEFESNSKKPLSFEDSFVLRNVDFGYKGSKASTLTKVNLHIEPGDVVGIIGETGSGKSTVVDLMLGLLSPNSGEIYLDGNDIGPTQQRMWRRLVSHVPQDIYLLDASLAENISLEGRTEYDHTRLVEAIQICQLEEFVAGLPDGYETYLGERGAKISGGQRQRIGIARAIYRGASILFLDEATSSLDSVTETQVMECILKSGKFSAIVSITHRSGALNFCNKVYNFSDGNSELLEKW